MNWALAAIVSIIGIAFIGILANVSDSTSNSLTTTSYLPANAPNDFAEAGMTWGSLQDKPVFNDATNKIVGVYSIKIL